MDLSKKDKKVARQIIELGLQRELESGLNKFDIILKNWKENKQSPKNSYHLLCKTLLDFDTHIEKRYENMTGSKYIVIISNQLHDKIISKDDINELSEEAKQKIHLILSL
jgi:isopentenyl diphosphate isomerase/L-lactate dehydrogenase-like FMN-dependent dehydrogenase